MLTYRVRPRIFRFAEKGAAFTFPNSATINLYFQPCQPFGEAAGGGRTAVRAVKAEALFNSNTGQHYIESAEPLKPLDVTLQAPDQRLTVRGTKLTLVQGVESLQQVQDLTESLYYGMPMLLALEFADPPYVERVDGSVGDVGFRWELEHWGGTFLITTQERQEEAVARAWDRLGELAKPGRRRLLAALHYFHTGTRLLTASVTAGEFLAEALLNFSKVLESLFPPGNQLGTIDAARKGLRELGFRDVEIEARFVPAILLRNKVDVGHVDFTLFKPAQLTILHAYAESAESHFKALFQRIFEGLAASTFQLAPRYPKTATAADQKTVDLIAAAMARDAAERQTVAGS